jgi:saccharopine dehydrogenase (NAD+, L-lysine forming)
MGSVIGIRREDKNRWERRVPLVPDDASRLQRESGVEFIVQPSPIRVCRDDEYRAAEISVNEDLGPASVILAVKEIPTHLLQPGKVYVYFAHVTKGQAHNMGMLRRLLELGCTLVDYEKIADEQKRRLIFFGRHAGYAGMIETLRGLGLRMQWEGNATCLSRVKPAYEYHDLADAKNHLRELASEFHQEIGRLPLVIGFSGYGNVSSGAQEVLSSLDPVEIPALELAAHAGHRSHARLLKVVFKEEDIVRPRDAGLPFDLQEYYRNPEIYESRFETWLPHLDALVNCIYWEPRYPRLVTREWADRNYGPGCRPRLKVIGDISCDVEGSIELTTRATEPDHPFFVYLRNETAGTDGIEGDGPVIMAVDNLPCELPRESSVYFSSVLRGMVLPLAGADWTQSYATLDVPLHLKKAIIVHRGELTPEYRYLDKYLEAHP